MGTMAKKLSLAIGLLGVVALATASAASAAALTSSPGVLAPPSTTITQTSTNTVLKTVFGTIGCEKVSYESVLVQNSEAVIWGAELHEPARTGCIYKGSEPANVEEWRYGAYRLGPGAAASMLLRVKLPGPFECRWESGSLAISYASGSDVVQVSGTMKPTPATCGTAEIKGNWTVEIGGSSVILD